MYDDDFDGDDFPTANGCTFCDKVSCDGSCEDDDEGSDVPELCGCDADMACEKHD